MRHAPCALIWLVMTAAALADSAPVRLALISDAEDKDLGALVTTELSGNSDISLVERDDLAKIGDELKLQQLAGSDAIALGKLAGADGLLFLSKNGSGLHARLSAVSLGYALFDATVESSANVDELAKVVAHQVQAYAQKLKLTSQQAIPISLLNLRADYSTKETETLERNLTLLLESHLVEVPAYVVLERRHAWSLGFEKSLDTTKQSLLQGAYVVDGNIELPRSDSNEIVVHLRVRSPQQKETSLRIKGVKTDLPALVAAISSEITRVIGSQSDGVTTWKATDEAKEYLKEGIWAFHQELYPVALEALDSAELLGNREIRLYQVRQDVLEEMAGQGFDSRDSSGRPLSLTAAELGQRTDAAIRGLQELLRLRALHAETPNRMAEIASAILVRLDDANAPRAEELRQIVRSFLDYDPLHGKRGPKVNDAFEDYWAESAEEELAHYHLCFTTRDDFVSFEFAKKQGDGFCVRFLKTPEEQKAVFNQMLQGLKDDPNGRWNYWTILANSLDQAQADAAADAYLDEMWKDRDKLVTDTSFYNEWLCLVSFPREVAGPRGQYRITVAFAKKHISKTLPLLHYYLQHRMKKAWNWEALPFLWTPECFPPEEAPKLWSEFQELEKRDPPDYVGKDLEIDFKAAFPALFTQSFPDARPLQVTRFWYPPVSPDSNHPPMTILFREAASSDALFVWAFVGNEQYRLYKIDLARWQTDSIDLQAEVSCMAASSQFLYAILQDKDPSDGVKKSYVARYDLTTKEWSPRRSFTDYGWANLYLFNCVLYGILSSGEFGRTHNPHGPLRLGF